jgi:phosphate:Na+ symporter
VQEALFLSSLEVGKHIDTFLFSFDLVYCLSVVLYENSHGSTGKSFDFSHYATMSLAVYLLIGFMITVVVQSSSVTMALTLSALHVSAISLPIAAAIILGSQTGTTIKIMGAIGGISKSESY